MTGNDDGMAASAPPVSLYDPMAAIAELEESGGDREHMFTQRRWQSATQFVFEDLKFSVGKKEILRGISGYANPGQVLAIMGPSGAGKTSLLDMLAGRVSSSSQKLSFSGAVKINGEKRNFALFRKMSAFVQQSDTLFAELTVRETITFSAILRLPNDMPRATKIQRVDQIINELGLGKCQNSYVGSALVRGVSGGERKRVNIGTELVTDPSLIFLDEPTSGLDSFNAQSVMQLLLKLAKNSRTIITTIHQPRSSIFHIFDTLMLLSDGNCMYFGPARDGVTRFRELGFPCPPNYNPADYFLDVVSLDQRTPHLEKVTRARIEFLAKSQLEKEARDGPIATMARASVPALPGTSPADLEDSAAPVEAKYSSSWLRQFWHLTVRSFRTMSREKASNIALVGQTILFGLLLGLIWLQVGGNYSGSSVQSIAGLLFFVLVNQSFSCMFGILFLFPYERSIVLKERSSRTFHVGAYFWSKTFAELPRSFFINVLFCILIYFLANLRDGAGYFFLFLIIVLLTQLGAEGLAYCVSALANDPQQAGAIAPAFIVTSMLFGGFFIGTNQIPVWLSWLKYLSFIKYGFAAAMQNEYQDRDLNPSHCSSSFCPRTGAEVLGFYDLDEIPFWANFVILICLIVAVRLIAYFILLRRGPKYVKAV